MSPRLPTLVLGLGLALLPAVHAPEPAQGLDPNLQLQPGDLPPPPRDPALDTDTPAEGLDSPCAQARSRLAIAERDLRASAPQGFAVGRQREMNARRDQALRDVQAHCQ